MKGERRKEKGMEERQILQKAYLAYLTRHVSI
jgi:hypothetical protein